MTRLSRRMQHLEAMFATTIVEVAEAQAKLADHLDQRDKELNEAENAADRRIFLRELIGEFERLGGHAELDQARLELGPDSEELSAADEALLDDWAARNNIDVAAVRVSRVRRIQSHLRWVEMVNRILAAMPVDEAVRVYQDIEDDGHRTPLTQRVKEAANRWAEATAPDKETAA